MGIEAIGKLYAVFDTKQVSERFTKREFVLELIDNPKYPQLVLFQATGDRCAQLDDFEFNEEVRVEFNLRGREWRSPQGEVKYFNSLDVWRIERVGARRTAAGSNSGSRSGSGSTSRREDPPPAPQPDDDIPF